MKNLLLILVTVFAASPLWAQMTHKVGFINSPQAVVPKAGAIHFAANLYSEAEWKQNETMNTHFRPRPGYVSMREFDPVAATSSNENLEVFRSEASFIASSANVNAMFDGADMYSLAEVLASGFSIEKASPNSVNTSYQETLKENYDSAIKTNNERRHRGTNPISDLEYNNAKKSLNSRYAQNKQYKWCNTDQGEPTCLRIDPDFGALSPLVSLVAGSVYLYSEMVGVGVDPANVPAEIASVPYTPIVLLALNGAEGTNLIQFTRTVISFHPVDAANTLVVVQHVTGIEASDLDKITPLLATVGGGNSRDFIMGNAAQNIGGGLSQGLPQSQYDVALKLKSLIDSKNF